MNPLTHGRRDFVVTGDERSSSWLVVQDLESILPVSTTPAIVQSTARKSSVRDRGIAGNLATWQETNNGTRWILAPVVGPLSTGLKPRITNGPATTGFIAAFKVEDQAGRPVLTPEWISPNIVSPQTPVVANGVVFVLSSGEFTQRINETGSVIQERGKEGTRAVLYAVGAREDIAVTAAHITDDSERLHAVHDQVDREGKVGGLLVGERVSKGALEFSASHHAATLAVFSNLANADSGIRRLREPTRMTGRRPLLMAL